MEALFVEDDILTRILMQLDVISLKHIESSTSAFLDFTKRTKLWKRKFLKDHPNFFDSALSEDILLRDQLEWDDHFKFKRLSLKYHSLLKNWKTKNFIKKTYEISSKIADEENILSINSNFLLTTTKSHFFNTVKSVYDLNNFTSLKTFENEPRYQVLSADFNTKRVVMFGEQQVARPSNYDYNYCIKIYCHPSYELEKQSVMFHEPELTPWSKVKFCQDKIFLFVSNLEGKDLNSEDNQDSVHIFSSADPDLKYIKHERKIILRLPSRKYLSKFHIDRQHIIGCRKKNTLVEIWSLECSELVDSCWVAPVCWSSDVSYGNLIKCSSVFLQTPLAFIGKSNARCDLWDWRLNVRLRSVVHGEPGIESHLLITRILLTKHYLLTLTSKGKLFLWDRHGGYPYISAWTVEHSGFN